MTLQLSTRQNGLPVFNFGTGAISGATVVGGVSLDDSATIFAASEGAIASVLGGIPFDSNGRMLVSSEAVSTYVNGLPMDASGYLCGGGITPSVWSNGLPMSADGAIAGWNPLYLIEAGEEGDFFNITTASLSQFWTGFDPSTAVVNLGDPVRVALSPRCLTEPKVAHLNGSTGTVITTPYNAAYQLTGRTRSVMGYRFNGFSANQSLGGRYQPGGNQRSWVCRIDSAGRPAVLSSTDGAAITTTVIATAITTVVSAGTWVWLEFVFVPDNGASGRSLTVRYSLQGPNTAPADIVWIAFDAVTTAGATTVFTGTTAGLSFGAEFTAANPSNGRASRYLLYDATDTLIADCDPSQYSTGSSFVSGGKTWTLAGQALITGDADAFITPTDPARFPYASVVPNVRNELIATTTLATQSVTVTAAQRTLSFKGTGTVTLSGVSTAGPLVGTGANDIVSLTFTPTAGTLTLTVSGSVTEAQLELGAARTGYQRVGAGRYDVTESGIPSVQCLYNDLSAQTGTIQLPETEYRAIFAGNVGVLADTVTLAGSLTYGPTTYTDGAAGAIAASIGRYWFGLFYTATALPAAQETMVINWFKSQGSP